MTVSELNGLEAAIRAAKLALFVINKQGVMPNSNWESGFNSDLKIAEDAKAALTAALSDQAGGWQLVPKEPTQAMLEAALALDAVSKGVLVPAGPYDVWQAMIASAPPPSSTAGEG